MEEAKYLNYLPRPPSVIMRVSSALPPEAAHKLSESSYRKKLCISPTSHQYHLAPRTGSMAFTLATPAFTSTTVYHIYGM